MTSGFITQFIRLALHLAPLYPLWERRWALLGALVLLMLLPYIKVQKMRADSLARDQWSGEKRAAHDRWHALTFLR